MILADYKITERKTVDLLNVWFAIMSNRPPKEYVEATHQDRAAFYLAICVEIDERVARADQLREQLDRLEARVAQLEAHPAGCSCTRCTG